MSATREWSRYGPNATWEKDRCPDAERLHTPDPSGYTAWHEWAKGKAKTHRQKRCPTCGLLAIWVAKVPT